MAIKDSSSDHYNQLKFQLPQNHRGFNRSSVHSKDKRKRQKDAEQMYTPENKQCRFSNNLQR